MMLVNSQPICDVIMQTKSHLENGFLSRIKNKDFN